MGSNRDDTTKAVNNLKAAMSGEKVSVNMTAATLAQIDLLVDQGYYSNRSSFINEAVRNSLDEKQATIDRVIEQKHSIHSTFFIGITRLDEADLIEWKSKGKKERIVGYGVFILDCDNEELIKETIESIHVVGKVYCSERIRKIYLP